MNEFSIWTFAVMGMEPDFFCSCTFSGSRMPGGFGYAVFCLATFVCNTLFQSGHQIHDRSQTGCLCRFRRRCAFFFTLNQFLYAFLIFVMESFRTKWRYEALCELLGEGNL